MKKVIVLFISFLLIAFLFISCSEDKATNPGSSGGNDPTVTITSPSDGESFLPGANIAFAGTGKDSEGNDLPDSMLIWTSDQDDTIGAGRSFGSDTLSLGTHVITLTGTDSEGRSGSESITIHINPPGFVLIRAGSFTMGSPTDEPGRDEKNETQHEVTLTNGFYMSKYEVTDSLWYGVMGGAPTTSQLPKNFVSWDMAVDFCNKLSIKDGYTPVYTINGLNGNVTWNRNADGYRLPTEAEWEYACRAGSGTAFNNNTNCLSSDTEANYYGENPLEGCPDGVYRVGRTQVGTFPPNDWGLYDMHGNLAEWVWDGFKRDYENLSSIDPVYDVGLGEQRVFRGGSYDNGASSCRSAYRFAYYAGNEAASYGFRICRDAR